MNKFDEMTEKRKALKISANPEVVEKIHSKGQYTAEERLQKLYDGGVYSEETPWIRNSCIDFDLYKKDVRNEGVITSHGKVYDRSIFAYSHDFTVMGGSMGEAQGEKIGRLIDYAIKAGRPVVAINEASGARIQEGVAALNGYCSVFGKTSNASGWIPQISIMAGTVAGGTAYAAALTDFIIMVKGTSKMFITGPAVIKTVTGEDVTFEELGGSNVHGNVTGTAHFVVNSEDEAYQLARRLLSFLPLNSKERSPVYRCDDPVNRTIPELRNVVDENPAKSFDVKQIILSTVDNRDFLEIQPTFAMSMVIGFARLNGKTVGIVANQPKIMAGCIDINASWKAARFVRFCDNFNIPLLTFADCPGYLPGIAQEHGGIIRNGAKLLMAYSEATVPKITIVLRKDYGGAYSAMCGKGMGADIVLAFPTAELAVMGADGAASIVFKKELKEAKDKDAAKKKLTDEYTQQYLNPYRGAEYGIVDDIIDPQDLRIRLIDALELLEKKEQTLPHKKHANMPL